MRIYILILTGAFLLSACGDNIGFEMKEVKIITKNAEPLASWYSKNLGFEISKDNKLLYHKNLTILLEEDDRVDDRATIKENYSLIEVPGFYKIGFITNQFESLVETLESNNVKFEGSVFHNEKLKKSTVVISDPDGNFIQIFEDEGPHKLKPYFFSIITEHVGEEEKWYQVKFPILETHILDQPENDLLIRILEGEDFAIELINVSDRRVKSELDYEEITGIYSIEVNGAKATFNEDHEGNKIISP